ncbi:hypothetical protein DLH72_03235, partial [Candidatus Gracilibacteria bacterium]
KSQFIFSFHIFSKISFVCGIEEEYKKQKNSNYPNENLEREKKWHKDRIENIKNIKKYFKQEHKIDNMIFEEEYFIDFFKNISNK